MKNVRNIIAKFLVVLTFGIGLTNLALAGNTAHAETNSAYSFFDTSCVNAYQSNLHKFYFKANETIDTQFGGVTKPSFSAFSAAPIPNAGVCNTRQNACWNRCDSLRNPGFTCYLDCRFEYFACVSRYIYQPRP